MRTRDAGREARYDRTVRTVMWLDAWLSVAMVAVCLVASPLMATLGVPPVALRVVGLLAAVSAVLLAAFGAITGVLLMLRLRAGHYLLPAGMRPPLPPGMNPFTDPVGGPVNSRNHRRRSTPSSTGWRRW